MSASDSAFEKAAQKALEACLDAAEAAEVFEADIQGGVLTLEAGSGKVWVLNKHAPMRQIWLSSPVSGASHYDLDPAAGAWRDTRGGPPLRERLAQELSQAAGRNIDVSL